MPVREPVNHPLALHANDRIAGPAHTDISDISRALRQKAFIRCLNVRMSTDYGRTGSIQKPTHRDLFSGGLGMHIDDDNGRGLPEPGNLRAPRPQTDIG